MRCLPLRRWAGRAVPAELPHGGGGGIVFDRDRVNVEFRRDLYRRAIEAMSEEEYAAADEEGSVSVFRVHRGLFRRRFRLGR